MSKSRYIPSLESLAAAARELPNADEWRAETFHVSLQDEHLIEFKRVQFKLSRGRIAYKWIYSGRVRVS